MFRSLAWIALSLGAGSVWALPALAQEASGRLVLYTSQPNQDAQQTVDAFTERYPDIEVDWVRDGTTRIMAKLRSEIAAGVPQPDVLLIADTVTMEGLKSEDRLLPYPEADVSAYDESLYDPDRTYFSTKLITTGLVYNTEAPRELSAWSDLTDPELEGQVAMPSPMTSGAAMIHLATLVNIPDLGWEYYEDLAANEIQPQGGNGGVFRAVAGGEKLYGVVVDFLPIRESQAGSPVQFVFPEEGVSAVTEPVAILSTANNPEAAKRFVDFILSPEGQQLAADQGYLPAHPDSDPPTGFPPRDQIELMPFDPQQALENDQEYRLRFQEIFGQ